MLRYARTCARVLPKSNLHYEEYPINYIITMHNKLRVGFCAQNPTAIIRFYTITFRARSHIAGYGGKCGENWMISPFFFAWILLFRESPFFDDDAERKSGGIAHSAAHRCYFLSSFFEAFNPIPAMRPSTTVAKVLSRCRARRRPSP